MSETPLGMTAEDFYEEGRKERTGVISIARRIAALTIPSVFPPEDYDNNNDTLEITNQSVNAFLVNGLANALMLQALPINLPICKFSADETLLQEDIQKEPELWSQTEYALSRREEVHRKRLQKTKARSAYVRSMRLLLVSGNCLCVWTKINKPLVYNMHHYVTLRDSAGTALVTVMKDSVSMAVADPDIKEAVIAHRAAKKEPTPENGWDDKVTIYHVQVLDRNSKGEEEWVYWQELEGGQEIADTRFYSPVDVPPMYPAQMIEETGSSWGLPYCHDYEGDLKSMEEYGASLKDGAAMMSWFLAMVDPTGQTNINVVKRAKNLDVISGRAQDISFPQVPKSGEFSAVSGEEAKVARRLGMAFASEVSIQRSGERVTAEEWKQMAAALDKAMGGLYSELSQSFQRWFVLRFIHLHMQENKKITPLPKNLVSIDVVTGLDGIGMSSDYENLVGLMKDAAELITPQGVEESVNKDDLLRRLAAYRAVKSDGLVKDPQQKAAEKQQAIAQQQQQTLLEKGAAPVAKASADTIAQMMQQQQGAQSGQQQQ